ncbi:DgyrCDS865 [Dimorphilus gyrociliatus]|uniref:DgyrCDS865 n=1 Tax=Dimorphilus gyrociliatus TaxID=2664684 RepID=A0A7I8V8N8_9ANNE|nr:DgyrCDS865 [Dimorphilus gyrociliatus]
MVIPKEKTPPKANNSQAQGKSLNLTGKTLSKQDFNQIGSMDNLMDLIMERNRLNDSLLKEIPFKKLTNLQRLSLADNEISLNENIQLFKGLENVQELNLGGNSIREETLNFESVWSSFKSLKVLKLNGNILRNITNFPASFQILQTFECENCQIDNIAGSIFNQQMKYVERLYLKDNNINSLPEIQAGSLLQLSSVDLTNNSIVELPICSFCSLPNLSVVKLDSNPIQAMAMSAFSDLPKLTTVTMSNTNLTEIPDNAFIKCSKLSYLDVSSSNIEKISPNLPFWNSLTNLLISNNHFCCDCHLKHLRITMLNKTDKAFCSTPKHLKGEILMSLKPDLFVCQDDNIPRLGVSPLAVVFGSITAFMALCALLFTIVYVRKAKAAKKENLLNETPSQRPLPEGCTGEDMFVGGFNFSLLEDDDTFPVEKKPEIIRTESEDVNKDPEIRVIGEHQKSSEVEFAPSGLNTEITPDFYKIAGTEWFEDDDELVLGDPVVLKLKL